MDAETKQYLEQKFGEIDRRFDEAAEDQIEILTLVDKRFNALDDRVEKVESRLDRIEDKLDSAVNQASGHDKRLTFLEERVLQ